MRRLIGFVELIPSGLRATLLYAAAMAWIKGLSMVTIPVLTSMLTPAQFGRLELLSSAAEIGGLITGAGLVDTLFRFASAPGAAGRRAGAEVAGLSLFIASAGVVAVVFLSPMIAAAMPLATPSSDIVLLGIAVALDSTIGVPLGWLRMHQRAGAFAALSMARAALQAALLVALVVTGHGVAGVLWAGCVTTLIIASVLTVRQKRETGIVFAPAASLRLLAYGLPLIGSGLAAFVLGTADRWLLAGTVSAAALGQYGLAAKIAMITAMLAQPFEMWWYPQRLGLVDSPEGLARSSRVVSAGAAGLLCAGAATALASPWLITLLAPPSYAPAQMMVPFLVLSLVLQLLSSMANAGCYARKTSNLTMGINTVAAAITLALYLLLIPRMGVYGAIAATVAGQATRLAMFATISQRTVPLQWPLVRLSAVAIAGVVAGAAPLVLGIDATGAGVGAAALLVTAVQALPIILGNGNIVSVLRRVTRGKAELRQSSAGA
nr:lipopolysaccharide biosynthesis protein [uncultured Rhodopila sp.]